MGQLTCPSWFPHRALSVCPQHVVLMKLGPFIVDRQEMRMKLPFSCVPRKADWDYDYEEDEYDDDSDY